MDQISDKTCESDWLSSMSIREIGISQAQVSRLEKGAIDKIKDKL